MRDGLLVLMLSVDFALWECLLYIILCFFVVFVVSLFLS
jgi:hypothetical protein